VALGKIDAVLAQIDAPLRFVADEHVDYSYIL
jgi:hypothetical protein